MIKTINPLRTSTTPDVEMSTVAACLPGEPELGDLTRPGNLPDHLLDYAVARAEGFELRHWPELGAQYWKLYLDGEPIAYIGVFGLQNLRAAKGFEHYSPSRNPTYSSEIITRERIGTHFDEVGRQWVGSECGPTGRLFFQTGSTPGIAALRCYVAKRARQNRLPAASE